MNFQELIKTMLDVEPENRPKASAVWEKLRRMIEFLGGKPHCETVSPVGSITFNYDERDDDKELSLLENWGGYVGSERSRKCKP
jgi:hypothetical protein